MADFRASKWLVVGVAVGVACCVMTSPTVDALPQFSNLRVFKSGWKDWRHLIDNLIPDSESGRKGSDSAIASVIQRLQAAKKSGKIMQHNNSPIRIRINPELVTGTGRTTAAPSKKVATKAAPQRRRSDLSKLPNSPIYYVHLPSRYFVAGRAGDRKDLVDRKDQVDQKDILALPIYVATTGKPNTSAESSTPTPTMTTSARPTKHPVTNSRIIHIKGPFVFNGKPGGIYSAPAPQQPANYWDALHKLYPKLQQAKFIR